MSKVFKKAIAEIFAFESYGGFWPLSIVGT